MVVLAMDARARPPDPIKEARVLIRQQKFGEAAKRLESHVASNPFDGPAWSAYAYALHMSKEFDRSIEAGKRACELGFNPAGETYNIACAYAVMGKTDEAIAWLKKALDDGFCEQETLEKDDEFDALRNEPRFIALTGLRPPPGLPPAEQWAWDMDFLARRMEQMHWNLYAKVPKETLRAEIGRLKADAPRLSSGRARVRLARILALVGDGHTTLSAFAEGESTIHRVPLHFEIFREGLYVIGTRDSHRDLLGARVLKVGPLAAGTALQKLRAYCSTDNEMTYLSRLPGRLTWPAALQEIGAAAEDNVEYTLRRADGSTRRITLAPEAMARKDYEHTPLFLPGYVYANGTCKNPVPVYQHELAKPLSLEWIDQQKAVYFGFHAVAENKGQTFAAFVDSMMKLMRDKRAENLIIDMRLNTGGNTGFVLPLIHALIRDDRVNRPGHLFVVIGHRTFSAAQNTVNLLEMHTHATFVGEPTGSRPNFVGESTYFVLPYSKLRVYCSSRYWQHESSTDRRTWVQPQLVAELSFRDFMENRDPCLEAIFERTRTTGD
jgi:hypothetical protein